MKSPDITEMGIIDVLNAALSGQIRENSGSKFKQKKLEVKRGVINSPTTRRIYAAKSILQEHAKSIAEKHSRLHDEIAGTTEHDCRDHLLELERLTSRIELLNDLFWQSVTEEHPVVAANIAALRDGWTLVDDDGKWRNTVLVPDRNSIANNFISRVTAIVSGTKLPISEDDLEPVAIGEELVGTLSDERIQTVWSLPDEVHNAMMGLLPAAIVNCDEEAIGNMTVNEVLRFKTIANYFKKLHSVSTQLFWCGVRDSVPEAADLQSIGIRRSWEVVKCRQQVGDQANQVLKSIIDGLLQKLR